MDVSIPPHPTLLQALQLLQLRFTKPETPKAIRWQMRCLWVTGLE